MLRLGILLPALMVAYTSVTLSESPGKADGWQTRPTAGGVSAERLLDRARTAAGLSKVDPERIVLEVDGRRRWANGVTVSVGFTVALPFRYQSRTGDVTHTLSGDEFWQNRDNHPSIQAAARKNVRASFLENSIVFLLAAPSGTRMSVMAGKRRDFFGKSADVVDFADDGGGRVRLFLSVTTGELLGYSLPIDLKTPSGANEGRAERVVRVLQRREVGGLRLPARLADEVGQFSSDFLFERIVVNRPGADEVFSRGGASASHRR